MNTAMKVFISFSLIFGYGLISYQLYKIRYGYCRTKPWHKVIQGRIKYPIIFMSVHFFCGILIGYSIASMFSEF